MIGAILSGIVLAAAGPYVGLKVRSILVRRRCLRNSMIGPGAKVGELYDGNGAAIFRDGEIAAVGHACVLFRSPSRTLRLTYAQLGPCKISFNTEDSP